MKRGPRPPRSVGHVELEASVGARRVVILFAATILLGVALLVAFEPDVQTIEADELVARREAARSFLIADYFFIALYALLMPAALWRFGATLERASPPRWLKLTAVLLLGAGTVDATENALLLAATGSVSPDTVDVAHALETPKVALFLGGAVLAIAALACCFDVLRNRPLPEP